MMKQETYEVKTVEQVHDITVRVPGSKSITNRALLIAAMAEGKSYLDTVLFSDDSRHFLQALVDLGFQLEINEEQEKVVIEGQGGHIPCVDQNRIVNYNGKKVNAVVQVGSAGTAARFLTAFLGLSKGRFYMESSEQMRKRPMEELLVALEQIGASIEYIGEPYHFPFIIGNDEIKGNSVEIDVERSSQFLSALLIAAPLFHRDFSIKVVGSHGLSYVDMTLQMMKQFGIAIKEKDRNYQIRDGLTYQALTYSIEPDMSAACYFYGMAALLKNQVLVEGVHKKSLQGDAAFLSVLESMGCKVMDSSKGVLVQGGEQLHGGSFDLSSFSDQALTLAALASFADTDVVIQNVGHIRHQECDRIHAIIWNLERLQGKAEVMGNDIVIHPAKLQGTEIDTFEDHRVAMSFALVGLLVKGVIIQNPMCCRKTFENYFETLETYVY